MFVLLPITSLYGQDITHDRSYESCHTSFETALMLNNIPDTVDLNDIERYYSNDTDIHQYYSNICNFIHDKYGLWITFADFADNPKNFDWSDFESKYYPNGMPDSVNQLDRFKGME
jgi:hypothetical protein